MKSSGITKEEAVSHPDDMLKVLQFQANYIQDDNKAPEKQPVRLLILLLVLFVFEEENL